MTSFTTSTRTTWTTAYARISHGSVTDTELQVGQFAIPNYVGPTLGEEEMLEADRYLRGRKEDLPKEYWFPDAYYGNEDSGGVRGHYYHVFDTDHPLCVLRLRYDTHQVTLVQQ